MRSVREVPDLPRRSSEAHKGDFGTVLLVAGSPGMLGAAFLAARAALRGGAGLVRMALPREFLGAAAVAVPAATSFDRDAAGDALCEGAGAIACGPGLGTDDEARRLLQRVLDHGRVPTVLDADALNLLAPLDATLPDSAPFVVTPHPGEAARLLGRSSKEVQGDRQQAVLDLATRSGAVAVLKGAGTLVTDGERLFTNDTGNPGMATGGSGDVLTGLLTSFLAQGMEPFDAACAAVHVHGRAGDRVARYLSRPGLIAEDLPRAIAEELAR